MHNHDNDESPSTEFDRVIDRRTTSSTKWNRFGSEVLPFWVADMDFSAPDFILNAVRERVEHGILGYTQTPPELVEAVCSWLRDQFGWDVSPLWLVWLSGVVPGFNLACRAVGSPGDSVMMNVPVYYPFLAAPGHGGRRAIEVPLVLDNGEWRMDFDAMADAAESDTNVFLLCNPQNPTGRCYSVDELEALAEFCAARDIVICSDEIHCSLLLDDHLAHTPIAALSEDIAKRSITLMAPTKTYNTPGLSCAFAIIPDPVLRRRFIEERAGLVPGISPLAYVAAQAAYQDQTDWVGRLCEYLRGNRNLLQSMVDSLPGVSMSHTEATYLAWLDTRDLPCADVPGQLERHGLGLSDGAQFHGPGFMRFNFGCPRPTLETGLDRLQSAIQDAAGSSTP